MLLRQQFGRCHDYGLKAGADRVQSGCGRYDSLATAYVSLQQAHHRMGLIQIGANRVQSLALVMGKLKT